MRKISFKKVLFGLSVSLVLAMAIGSFAIGETQTPVNPQAAEINADTGDFVVSGDATDYSFDGTTLTIHGTHTISMASTATLPTSQRILIDNTADITLDNVKIETSSGAALEIADDAAFDVNITLADNSENTLTATADNYAGLQKSGGSSAGTLTISGTGELKATGGYQAAGIGGGNGRSGSNIKISGGTVTATGVGDGAGIGGGYYAGGSNNSITGDNVVVIAEVVGGSVQYALSGFSSIDKGLIFRNGSETHGSWRVDMYSSSVDVTADVTIPANLTVGAGKVLTVDSGATFAVPDGITLATSGDGQIKLPSGGTLQNDGNIADGANISGTGNITTRTHFYLTDGTTPYGTDDYYQIYKAGGNVQKYKDLPNPDDTTLLKNSLSSDKFLYWYYLDKDGKEVAIKDGDAGDDVLPNQHDFYEKRATAYAVTIPTFENGSVTSDMTQAAENETVTLTVTPAAGYQLQENSLKVMAGTTSVTVTKGADGKYTFTMPASNVNVSAVFEPITYSITIATLDNGSITSNVIQAAENETVTLTVTPAEGYELQENSLKVMAGTTAVTVTKGADGKYTFKMPASAVTVSATFEGTSHKVTIDQPENGTVTIDPESPRTGDEVTITIKPDDGYKPGGTPVVKDEDGNEIELTPTGNPNEYKFTMPNSDLTVDVNFVPAPTPTPPEPTPEPTPDPSVNPDDGGSGSGASSKTGDPFMGGIALALLGVATTGAVLVRKRK